MVTYSRGRFLVLFLSARLISKAWKGQNALAYFQREKMTEKKVLWHLGQNDQVICFTNGNIEGKWFSSKKIIKCFQRRKKAKRNQKPSKSWS